MNDSLRKLFFIHIGHVAFKENVLNPARYSAHYSGSPHKTNLLDITNS